MQKRIIICGMPRSGTSIFYILLSNNLEGIEFYEKEISSLNVNNNNEVCLTKRPLDCMILDQIFDKFKDEDLKVIFCIRDPRDVICSTIPTVPHDYFIGFQNQYFVDLNRGIRRLINPGIRQISSEWKKHKDNIFTLKYEDLILKREEIIDQIADFLDINLDHKQFDITEGMKIPKGMIGALNGLRKLDAKSIGIWKKHPVRVWEEFTNHVEFHEVMKFLNYEENEEWFLRFFIDRLPIKIHS